MYEEHHRRAQAQHLTWALLLNDKKFYRFQVEKDSELVQFF